MEFAADDSQVSSDLVFAADLGGTHLRAAAIDQAGQIHFRSKRQTPRAKSPDEIVQTLIDAVNKCDSSEEMQGKRIGALSIAVPGTVSFKDRRVITVPNLPCLTNFDLGPALQEKLNRPVLIENDANAAAAGEMWLGAGQNYRNIICITLGTGVGGGIIVDGELLRGVDGSAGEIGHTSVDPFSGVNCKCGSEGCLEVYASATGIVRMAREALSANPISTLGTIEDLTAKEIFEAAVKGDDLAISVFTRMGESLGVGLANLINLFNPEVIIIGGGVANGWEFFNEPMLRTMTHRSFPAPAKRVKITRAKRGDDAGLLGAARLMFASKS